MKWMDKIRKLQILKVDYGEDFGAPQRYEYTIMTLDIDGNTDTIPGVFESGTKALIRIREIAKDIRATGRKCTVIQKVAINTKNGGLKLEEKRKDKAYLQRIDTANRRYKMAQSNSNPGGARRHVER